jgi:hypothetical protein
MKSLFEEAKSSPQTSNSASTSCHSKEDDQEMGSNALSNSADHQVLNNSPFFCFPLGMNLNLVRAVRKKELSISTFSKLVSISS